MLAKMRNLPLWVWLTGAAAVIALVALASVFVLAPTGPNNHVDFSDVYAVERRDITNSVVSSGTVDSDNTAEVYTRLTAPVSQVAVKVGDRVQKDQVLLRLDGTEISRQIAVEQATKNSTQASNEEALRAAQQAYNQAYDAYNQAVADSGDAEAVDRSALTEAESALRTAQSAYNNGTLTSDETIGHLENDQASTTLVSPMAGVVAQVNAQVGQPAGGVLVRVADDQQLIINGTVDEKQLSRITPGQKVEFTTGATGEKKFTGRVDSVSKIAQTPSPEEMATEMKPNEKRFPVKIIVDGENEDLAIGASAKAHIISEQAKQVLAVPREAVLVDEDGTTSVLVVVERDGLTFVERREVTTGIQDDFYVEITGKALADEAIKVLNQATKYRDYADQEVLLMATEEGK